ncbi:MAG: PASTA domain-containing protein [Candidatus Hydrogenedens sp.]|jgi:beta-lactam-binding protein with PASTA domain|nr:PASTA domain-containing protein [Candidatus Hydrogenedens sp.]
MKTSFLLPVFFLALLLAGGAFAEVTTESCLRFDDEAALDQASEMLGVELFPERDSEGKPVIILPEEAARFLRKAELPFEILWTRTEISGGGLSDKSEKMISGNGSGFPINFRNQQHVTIGSAPDGAVVSKVSLSLSGIAAYADLCTFSIISSRGTKYTLEPWYDEIWFDHTVNGIMAFNGESVNQRWTLEGQGSNTAGERVERWTIRVYYKTSPGGDDPQHPEGETDLITLPELPWSGWYRCPMLENPIFTQRVILGERYVSLAYPMPQSITNPCYAYLYVGRPHLLANTTQKRVEISFQRTELLVCSHLVDLICGVDTLIGPLSPGTWTFVSHGSPSNPLEPSLNERFTVTAVQSHEPNLSLVPDVYDTTLVESTKMIQEAGLTPGTFAYDFSDEVAETRILGSTPAYGDLLPVGSVVSLTISMGPDPGNANPEGEVSIEGEKPSEGEPGNLTEVPDCVRLWISEIPRVLERAHLKQGELTEEYHETLQEKIIIRQNPEAGTRVPRNSTVDLVVSLGPRPLPVVPVLVGMDLSEAKDALLEAGFALGTTTYQHDEAAPYNQVLSQTPKGNSRAKEGSLIDLVLSEGPPPVNNETIWLPDLRLRTLAEARQDIADLGLVVGEILEEHDSEVYSGRVIRQDPEGGRYVSENTVVHLVISLGHERGTAVPVLRGLSEAEALEALTTADLLAGEISYIHDAEVAEGHVVAHEPAVGQWMPKGGAVDLVLSLGPDPADMEGEPDPAEGEDMDEGEAVIEGEGPADPEGEEFVDDQDLKPEGEEEEEEGTTESCGAGCSGGKSGLADLLLLGVALLVLGNRE